VPQAPQLAGSIWVSTHLLLHSVVPPRHDVAYLPGEDTSPVLQAFPPRRSSDLDGRRQALHRERVRQRRQGIRQEALGRLDRLVAAIGQHASRDGMQAQLLGQASGSLSIDIGRRPDPLQRLSEVPHEETSTTPP